MDGAGARGTTAIENFLLEDYKLKTDFLKAQFERLWKRFEFFLVIESALFAFFFSSYLPRREMSYVHTHGCSLSWAYFQAPWAFSLGRKIVIS